MLHQTRSGPAKLQRVVAIADIKYAVAQPESCDGRW
jgi:hypothetical protein